jgi:hypothetical protein
MYCVECGQSIPESSKFCAACGTPTVTTTRKVSAQLRPSTNEAAVDASPKGDDHRPRRAVWRTAAAISAGVVILAGGVYGLMLAGVIPGHQPGNSLVEDTARWDPFTREEVTSAIRAFDAKIDAEEREAKATVQHR